MGDSKTKLDLCLHCYKTGVETKNHAPYLYPVPVTGIHSASWLLA